MDDTVFGIDVLTRWVLTGGDFEALLAQAVADYTRDPQERDRLTEAVRQDFQRLQEADLEYLRRLRGNKEKLADEIAAILRW